MKKINVLMICFSLLSTNAFAAAAVSYSCAGKNKVNDQAIVFDLLFADSAPGAGYTNQSITITKATGNYLEKPIVFQMFGANQTNECLTTDLGETYLVGDNFEMNPAREGDLADYMVSFKSACKGQEAYDVTAYCMFDF